jgi:hypothetical protein
MASGKDAIRLAAQGMFDIVTTLKHTAAKIFHVSEDVVVSEPARLYCQQTDSCLDL